ncbi:MAG: CSLREA domain-containing protein [Anaerolineales bacterium]|nr:CSLREA domain-containing protein [Anaerolineales bacterium]
MRTSLLKSVVATCGLMLALAFALGLVHPVYAATWLVDTAVDEVDGSCTDGDCSLRDAIAAAADGDTILFAGDFTIFLDGPLDLAKTITISGESHAIAVSGDSAGDGSPNVRVFHVAPTGAATLANISVISGTTPSGPDDGCPAFCGGGIVVDEGGALTILNATVAGNGGHRGGGIASMGALTVLSGTISGNSARLSAGAIWSSGALTVVDSTIAYNLAITTAGGIRVESGIASISNTAIYNNEAIDGGGLYVVGEASVAGGEFEGNFSQRGGGIFVESSGVLTLSNGLLDWNEALFGGGGVHSSGLVSVSNTLFQHSYAGNGDGGGIYNAGGTLSVASSRFFLQWCVRGRRYCQYGGANRDGQHLCGEYPQPCRRRSLLGGAGVIRLPCARLDPC